MPRRLFCALALAGLPLAAAAENYLGILKPPKSTLESPGGFFSFAASSVNGLAPSLGVDNGLRMRLGYKYSPYFSVESEFVDFGRPGSTLFASPANLASAFRSTGFGVDTVATMPWRSFSFYGRLGAYRGEARSELASYSTSLIDGPMRGTRWHYGLGVRYDFTKAFGVRAELERYSPLGTPLASDTDTDSITLGVSWRF